MQQFDSSKLVLASSSAADILEFHHKLAAAAKPAEIDLIQLTSFDPECALWPSNQCCEVFFEINDALALRLDQSRNLNRKDEALDILYQK